MTGRGLHRTRDSLGRLEADFLAQVGPQGPFTVKGAERILGPTTGRYVRQFLARLEKKGWIARIKPGLYVPIPLSSGTTGTPQLHEFLVAMTLVQPAAIAYFSAMNYHGFTEQIPRQVFITTDHKVSRPSKESLGVSYRIVSQRPQRFFGLRTEWINESPFQITDPEKTLVDGLALPEYVGGVGMIAHALLQSWSAIDEKRLHDYVLRMGTSAVAKRLGFLQERLALGNPEALRNSAGPSTGYPRLDPTLPAQGTHNRRWGLLVNATVAP